MSSCSAVPTHLGPISKTLEDFVTRVKANSAMFSTLCP